MPYSGGEAQRRAIFLSIKRKRGEAAARAWAEKHKGENFHSKRKRAARRRGR